MTFGFICVVASLVLMFAYLVVPAPSADDSGRDLTRKDRPARNLEKREALKAILCGVPGPDEAPAKPPKAEKQDPAERRMESQVGRAAKRIRLMFDEEDEVLDRLTVTYGSATSGSTSIVIGEAVSGAMCVYVASALPAEDQCVFLLKNQLQPLDESVTRQRRR